MGYGVPGLNVLVTRNGISVRVKNGSVIREIYRRMVQDYRSADNAYISYIWKLWMVFAIELWFNVVFNRKQKVNWPNAA